MKKNIIKKLLVTAAFSSLLVIGESLPAYASLSDSTSETIGGVTVSASISTDIMGATAETSCPRVASVSANATAYYWWGSDYYQTSSYSSVSGGTTVTTAVKKRSGADVVGGKGVHYVGFNNSHWDPTTIVGITPSNAISE